MCINCNALYPYLWVRIRYLSSLGYDQSKIFLQWFPIQILRKSPYYSVHFISLTSLRICCNFSSVMITKSLTNVGFTQALPNQYIGNRMVTLMRGTSFFVTREGHRVLYIVLYAKLFCGKSNFNGRIMQKTSFMFLIALCGNELDLRTCCACVSNRFDHAFVIYSFCSVSLVVL